MLTATDRRMNGMMSPALKNAACANLFATTALLRPGTPVRDTDGLFVHTYCAECSKPVRVSAEGFEKTKEHWCQACGKATLRLLKDNPLEILIRREEKQRSAA